MARATNRFSPSQLGDFEDCPRAYWLARNHGVAWPRGIFPSLPGGVDRILKDHYDKHRALNGLPPELAGKVPGVLYPDQARMDRWRNWRTGLEAEIEVAPGVTVTLSGALDDLLVDEASVHYVFDAKSRGSAPKPGDTEKYYGRQANCYAHMLQANGMKVSPRAFFGYYHPEFVDGGGGLFSFACDPVEIEVNPEAAVKLVREAWACLQGPIPDACKRGCEKCAYIDARASVGRKLKAAAEAAA